VQNSTTTRIIAELLTTTDPPVSIQYHNKNMMIPFTVCFLLLLAVANAMERRGSWGSFSAPEQALFGSSFAEDCVLGSSAGIFVPYSMREKDDKAIKEVKKTATEPVPATAGSGFESPPAFVSHCH
jgi:hypothetical protein